MFAHVMCMHCARELATRQSDDTGRPEATARGGALFARAAVPRRTPPQARYGARCKVWLEPQPRLIPGLRRSPGARRGPRPWATPGGLPITPAAVSTSSMATTTITAASITPAAIAAASISTASGSTGTAMGFVT